MKTKNFLVAGLVGGIVNFLLGWLFYGMLFSDIFPQPEESSLTMVYIFLGCLTLGLFISYIYAHWAQISTLGTGTKAGAVIGLFIGLFYNFFHLAMNTESTLQLATLDVAISVVMTAITGAAIAIVIGKMS